MTRRSVAAVALLVLIVLFAVWMWIAPNIGIQSATPAEENAVLRKLQHATARQTLDALFWAVNHHGRHVKAACLEAEPDPSIWFDEARRWEIISIKEVPGLRPPKLTSRTYRTFDVRFPVFRDMSGAGRNGYPETKAAPEWV